MTSPVTYRLGELTSPETEAIDKSHTVVLIPVGAFEQHGPGLPLATDQIRARALCDIVAGKLCGRAYVGPEMPVGISPHHASFPGTVTLEPETFIRVITEYALELHRNGWTRVLVVTGHGGNNAALGVVAQKLLGAVPELEFAWTPITGLAQDVITAFGPAEVTGHCGEAETSQMLFLAPATVRREALRPGTTQTSQLNGSPRLSRSARPALSVRWERLSENGVLGDPTRATAELGQDILEAATRVICDFVTAWVHGQPQHGELS